jgi:hypothetical protein
VRAQRDPRRLAPGREEHRALRLAFELIRRSRPLAAAALLHDVSELVRDDKFTARALQIDAAPEMDLLRSGERLVTGQHLGAVDVELDVVEAVVKRLLHPIAHRRRQTHGALLGSAATGRRGRRHPHRGHRLRHLAGTRQHGVLRLCTRMVAWRRKRARGRLPAVRFGDDQRGPARRTRCHLVDTPAVERTAIELDAGAGEPADIRSWSTAAGSKARGELVKRSQITSDTSGDRR